MPKYETGDIECTVVIRSDGRFQGRVIVAASPLKHRSEVSYVCPELDDTKAAAMRRAMNYANAAFPPE